MGEWVGGLECGRYGVVGDVGDGRCGVGEVWVESVESVEWEMLGGGGVECVENAEDGGSKCGSFGFSPP